MHQSTLVMLDHGYALSFTFIAGMEDEVDDLVGNLSLSHPPARKGITRARSSLQRLGLQRNVLLACRFFRGVFLHPGFPALACGGVAAGKSQSGNVGIRYSNFFVRALGIEVDDGIFQRGCAAPVEQVTFNLRSVFASDRYVAAIIESFLECAADFFVTGKLRNPTLDCSCAVPGATSSASGLMCGTACAAS